FSRFVLRSASMLFASSLLTMRATASSIVRGIGCSASGQLSASAARPLDAAENVSAAKTIVRASVNGFIAALLKPNAHANPPAPRTGGADRQALACWRSVLSVLLGVFRMLTVVQIQHNAE